MYRDIADLGPKRAYQIVTVVDTEGKLNKDDTDNNVVVCDDSFAVIQPAPDLDGWIEDTSALGDGEAVAQGQGD